MGHRDSSAEFGGQGGIRALGGGTSAPAAQSPQRGPENMSLPARALLFAVRLYQAFFSGLMPSACKFYPSCSHYAAEAVRIHGARRGSLLALRRLSRCHPFTPGGVDLVPDASQFPERSRTGFRGCGKTQIVCHSERSEESLFDLSPAYREILRRKPRFRMTTECFFRSLFSLSGLNFRAHSQNRQAEARPTKTKEVRS
jgi:putative membrane protein insertion efficiency factor